MVDNSIVHLSILLYKLKFRFDNRQKQLIYRHFIQYLIAIYITEQQAIIKHLQVRDHNQSMVVLIRQCGTFTTRQIGIHKATSTDSIERRELSTFCHRHGHAHLITIYT